ncbi:hypothetical protein COO60DRAFT_1532986 [Scenedesmus sp. NREL 46B-D3]|nr:hypothetical protein COO60DRAFT_1532986 [Scenedesmus sp. NREL 46B-D3]
MFMSHTMAITMWLSWGLLLCSRYGADPAGSRQLSWLNHPIYWVRNSAFATQHVCCTSEVINLVVNCQFRC